MKGSFLLWLCFQFSFFPIEFSCQLANVTSLYLIPFPPMKVTEMDLEKPQPRIYGGKQAKYSDYPFMICILCKRKDKTWISWSASLVGSDWILTAATSVKLPMIQPRDFFLVGGTSNLNYYAKERMNLRHSVSVNETKFMVEERRASKIFIHPNFKYNEEQIIHNIALVKTHKPFSLLRVKLATVSFEKIKERRICTIIGWGFSTQNFILTYAADREVSTMELGCKYHTKNPLICLVNDEQSGICASDTGGPLLCKGKVSGVASYSISPSLDCKKSYEDYYTQISSEKEWFDYVLSRGIKLIEINTTLIFLCVFTSLWTWQDVFN